MEELEIRVDTENETNPDLERKWLTFWLDGQLYGAPVAHVEQIVSMMPITEIPEYPVYSKGIINIRGSIVPLIDLRVRLGKEEVPYTDSTCIVICRIEEAMVGFVADAVDAVISIEPEQIVAPPEVMENAANFLIGVARLPGNDGAEEKLILCLNTKHVLLSMDADGSAQ